MVDVIKLQNMKKYLINLLIQTENLIRLTTPLTRKSSVVSIKFETRNGQFK